MSDEALGGTKTVVVLPPRHAIARSFFFLKKAADCSMMQRDEFEAYIEAAIVFGRAALHRLQARHKAHPDWKTWWDGLKENATVEFFRRERDWILKEGPPKVGQVIGLGGKESDAASQYYFFEQPAVPATETVERHLETMKELVAGADARFKPIENSSLGDSSGKKS